MKANKKVSKEGCTSVVSDQKDDENVKVKEVGKFLYQIEWKYRG